MSTQTYATHRYTPKLTAVGFLFLVVAAAAFILRGFDIGGPAMFAAGLASLMVSNLVLLAISRIYITKLQDRIIRLEMTYRCARLLPPVQQAAVERLSLPQLIALRFASDGELGALADRAARDRLTPDQIKQAITIWVPDLDRT